MPERSGRQRKYALGKTSGKANIENNLQQLGIQLSEADLKKVTSASSSRRSQGSRHAGRPALYHFRYTQQQRHRGKGAGGELRAHPFQKPATVGNIENLYRRRTV